MSAPMPLWVYGTKSRRSKFHLAETLERCWSLGELKEWPVARCGQLLSSGELSDVPPDNFELCDACVLADLFGPSVYRFFDAEDHLLYVGCSDNLFQRFMSHANPSSKSRAWWPLQRRHTIESFPSKAEAFRAETAAIDAEKPLFMPSRKKALRALAVAA
jgi:predicted GIY-YIG superfamily endonuclease